ncbi:U2-type spliceosomal complex subunit CWC21 [Aspergillus neoniger CBS 115656]|uniref:CWF21 domain-containing protein n=1 Tax=Aspergillus neoniger (strain CBS 115656) TaxID=1448310 RepID=A0A318YV89_ASPNB|nr:hypothetical protein BO87DRAFT_373258 [Aspergillus neoniger CBS 115656]PYH38396.1 hypothetical protein BO87DRAFT_373258 [Aspergillus neoniger CBS 115656]
MSSNVGLSTPRGSGTSGYVQRNFAFMKPRNAGYGAPYPPISGANSSEHPLDKPFKQRQPDKQILEHDRRRAIEVKVMEERERLEEENERIEEEERSKKKKGSKKEEDEVKKEEGEEDEGEGDEEKVLTEEEIDERCEALRKRLVREMEEERERGDGGGNGNGGGAGRRGRRAWDLPPKERRQFKSYQVHELAEAKIEESERLRRALGIKEEK